MRDLKLPSLIAEPSLGETTTVTMERMLEWCAQVPLVNANVCGIRCSQCVCGRVLVDLESPQNKEDE